MAMMENDGKWRISVTEDISCRRLTLGDRAFPAAAARAWNLLPCHIRDMPFLLAFRRKLKTVLFRLSYPVD